MQIKNNDIDMMHLNKPVDDPRKVFVDCVSAITDLDLKRRLANCANDVVLEAENYEKKALKNELHNLIKNKSTKANKNARVLMGEVTINEMKKVYTTCFVPVNSPGRFLYDRILALPINSRCPYCFHRQVSTVDHYLPKAYYPLLSVVPINLVPSCKDCNMGKSGDHATQASEELLHPYYDNVEGDLWLKAEVKQTLPVSLRFFVDCPTNWNLLLKSRVEHHFDSLKLNLLYSAEAANELININYQLKQELEIGGSVGVQYHLVEAANTRKKGYINSWQSAMYTALSKDLWFCAGGFDI